MNEVEAVKDLSKVPLISELLVKHHGQHFADIWDLGINLALRISDLLDVKFTDVEGTHLKLVEQKTKKTHTIKLNEKAKSIIERRLLESPGSVYLFQATARNVKTIKPLTRQAVGQAFKAIGEVVGINLSTHSMRKTRGYHVYKKTNDIAQVMKMLNHSSPKVTLRYIGIDQEEQDTLSDEIIL